MPQATHPTLSHRQTDILFLLYRFRFLTRSQIQTLLHHSHHSRILAWLNDLADHHYIHHFFDKQFISAPAIYSLGPASRLYLKSRSEINATVLNRVWREKKYTAQFRQHCIFIADVYLSLLALTVQTKATLHFYTQADLYGTDHLISPKPDAYFAIEEGDGTIQRYFLELFEEIPAKVLRQWVRRYLDYFASWDWQDNTDKPFPAIILVCPNERLKHHLYFYIQNKLEDPAPSFYLTTQEDIKQQGLIREVLQKVDLNP